MRLTSTLPTALVLCSGLSSGWSNCHVSAAEVSAQNLLSSRRGLHLDDAAPSAPSALLSLLQVSSSSSSSSSSWSSSSSSSLPSSPSVARHRQASFLSIPKSASFFDSWKDEAPMAASSDQIGAGGLAPPEDLAAAMLFSQTRRLEGSLKCKDPGCEASTTLQVFDPSSERASQCRLSLHVHPTDFDDEYSGERVRFIKAGGALVQGDCFPVVSGCNASTGASTFSCLEEFPVDTLIDESGNLSISAAISDVVDECPFEGNLLSSVPVVECLISPLHPPTTPPPTPAEQEEPTTTPLEEVYPTVLPVAPVVPSAIYPLQTLELSLLLHCPSRGCTASGHFALNNESIQLLQKCTLGVKVNQTDFDGDDGTLEEVEFLKINDVAAAEHVSPGSNPCRIQWSGQPVTPEHQTFSLLDGKDVTDEIKKSNGTLKLEVKISDKVDECAYQGYLLSGSAAMTCTFGVAPPPAPVPAANTDA